jgi:hypothetical protein
MAYWACAQTAPRRESVARHFLQLAEFEVYFPQIRERCVAKAGKVELVRPLFPSYLFVRVELQWWAACKAIGVARLILDGERPAVVPDQIVEAFAGGSATGLCTCRGGRNTGAVKSCGSSPGRFAGIWFFVKG